MDLAISALEDPDEDVVYHAVKSIRAIGNPKAVQPLKWLLEARSGRRRCQLLWTLAALGDEDTEAALLNTVADRREDDGTRATAADALGELGNLSAVETLMEVAEEMFAGNIAGCFSTGPATIDALAKLQDPRCLGLLVQEYLSPKEAGWWCRLRMPKVLGEFKGDHLVGLLVEGLTLPDRESREKAASALGDFGNATAVAPLIQTLTDGLELRCVRGYAARALGKLGDVRAVGPLIRALAHGDHAVRLRAADALGELGDTRAVAPLRDAHRAANVDGFKETYAQAIRRIDRTPRPAQTAAASSTGASLPHAPMTFFFRSRLIWSGV